MSPSSPQVLRLRQPVLITGGSGFIGCNLASALAQRGQNVVVLDSLIRKGTEENLDWLKQRHPDRVSFERGDVRDGALVRKLVAQSSAVLHLAAQVAVTTSLEDPLDDFEVNARGTLNVLEAVRVQNPSAPVVFASTNKVYGKLVDEDGVEQRGLRYTPKDSALVAGVSEQAPLDFYSPYGCSKGSADQYVRDYARVFGLRTAVLRMSCIYGTRQFGNEDQGWMAHFLLQALQGKPITIYGDGYQVRDALYIDDAVAAWLATLDRIDEAQGRVYNLGGGPRSTTSLRELLAVIEELTGTAVQTRFDAWRPGDQPWYVSDIRGLERDLGWRARVELRDGLRLLLGWLQSRFGQSAAPALQEARA